MSRFVARFATVALTQMRHPLAADSQDLVRLRAGGHLELGHAAQDRHFDLVAQRQVGERERKVTDQIGALAGEDFVLADPDEHVEIAGAMGLGEWNESKMDVRRIKL